MDRQDFCVSNALHLLFYPFKRKKMRYITVSLD